MLVVKIFPGQSKRAVVHAIYIPIPFPFSSSIRWIFVQWIASTREISWPLESACKRYYLGWKVDRVSNGNLAGNSNPRLETQGPIVQLPLRLFRAGFTVRCTCMHGYGKSWWSRVEGIPRSIRVTITLNSVCPLVHRRAGTLMKPARARCARFHVTIDLHAFPDHRDRGALISRSRINGYARTGVISRAVQRLRGFHRSPDRLYLFIIYPRLALRPSYFLFLLARVFFINNRSRIIPSAVLPRKSRITCSMDLLSAPLLYSNNPLSNDRSCFLDLPCRNNVTIHKTIDSSSKLVIETRRTGERGAHSASGRTSCLVRRHAAVSCTREGPAGEPERRGRSRWSEQERERERELIHARTKTREARENGDTRATRAAVPLQLNHSKLPPLAELPPPHAHHVVLNPPVDPLRRPLTTLFLSRSPSIVYHSFSLPFVAPTISILFCFVILVPRRSTSVDSVVCDRFGFYLPSISLLLPSPTKSLCFPCPREYYSPSGKHRGLLAREVRMDKGMFGWYVEDCFGDVD